MKAAVNAACLIAVLTFASGPSLSAQWRQAANTRRAEDRHRRAEHECAGPADRGRQARPFRPLAGGGGGLGGQRGAAPAPAPPPTGPPVAAFADVAQNIKGGLPLTPAWGGTPEGDGSPATAKTIPRPTACRWGSSSCTHKGAPRKFVQTPEELIILYEASAERREIFIDGRSVPTSDDPQPWWNGYSSGRWDGDTLVVETSAFSRWRMARHHRKPADRRRDRITERFRRSATDGWKSTSRSRTRRPTRSRSR